MASPAVVMMVLFMMPLLLVVPVDALAEEFPDNVGECDVGC